MGSRPFVVSVLGLKASGKTTVCEALIAALSAQGYEVGALKQTRLERLNLDPRGTDSARMLAAGASFVAVRSREETLTVARETGGESLAALLALVPPYIRIVVAEGIAPEPEEGPCVVLCLKERELLEETMRIRAVSERQVLACAGVFASSARSAEPSPFPIYDVLDPQQREALCARVLATAGLEASAPLPPSAG